MSAEILLSTFLNGTYLWDFFVSISLSKVPCKLCFAQFIPYIQYILLYHKDEENTKPNTKKHYESTLEILDKETKLL